MVASAFRRKSHVSDARTMCQFRTLETHSVFWPDFANSRRYLRPPRSISEHSTGGVPSKGQVRYTSKRIPCSMLVTHAAHRHTCCEWMGRPHERSADVGV